MSRLRLRSLAGDEIMNEPQDVCFGAYIYYILHFLIILPGWVLRNSSLVWSGYDFEFTGLCGLWPLI